MKKISVILAIVVALAYVTHRIDMATRVKSKSQASGALPMESIAGTLPLPTPSSKISTARTFP
jgi:hypothetical protein